MQIEKTIKPVSPIYSRSDSKYFRHNKETFYDILQRTLNNRSNSRPPKTELIGILIPLPEERQHGCRFKIETDQSEILLSMNESTQLIAKKLAWEEVVVKGFLNEEERLFEVEKIALSNRNEPFQLSLNTMDLQYEIESYKRTITKKGKIDVAAEYLAS